jgi:hypothetical protein
MAQGEDSSSSLADIMRQGCRFVNRQTDKNRAFLAKIAKSDKEAIGGRGARERVYCPTTDGPGGPAARIWVG